MTGLSFRRERARFCHGQAWLIVALSCGSATGMAAGGDAWEHWRPAADQQQLKIDHGAWATLLERYLDAQSSSGVALFDYGAVTAADRKELADYIDSLTALQLPALTRSQQMAYWINLYNALTVQVILDNWPVDSIKEIRSGIFSPGPWKQKLARIDGKKLSLDDIEHRILRPIYGDARVHFAVNCASIGCPDLAVRPYTAETLDAMLEEGARRYLGHPRGARKEGKTLVLSSLFDWYGGDFGDNRAEALAALAAYAEPELAGLLRSWQGKVVYEYDWLLNAPGN